MTLRTCLIFHFEAV